MIPVPLFERQIDAATLPQFHLAAWQDETDLLLCGNMRLSYGRRHALMDPSISQLDDG